MNSQSRTIIRFLLFALLGVSMLGVSAAIPSGSARAATGVTFTVNSNSDADTNGDTFCTLREAINAEQIGGDYHECVHSGSGFGNDLIDFSISGSSTITLTSDLYTIFRSGYSLTIDGSNSGNNVVINGNDAYQPFFIEAGTTLTLENLTVENGFKLGSGGGLYNVGTLNIFHSSFLDNSASADGGGLVNGSGGVLTIANSTFTGNSASFGGGMENNAGNSTILNSTFSGNSASSNGGAFSTYNGGGGATPVTTIKNTIMANSSAPEDCYTGSVGTPTGDHNIIEVSSGIGGGCAGITSSTADPLLDTMTGSPAYFPLLAGSPAQFTGNNAVCKAAPVNNTSENGVTRPQGLHCDIGSYETLVPKTTLTVSSTGAQDGWVRESSENGNVGAALDSSSTMFFVGDDAARRQYRGVLSFATGAPLPDTAAITQVTLKMKKSAVVGGGNPVTLFQGFMVDMKNGTFGSASLQFSDFQSAASHSYGPFVTALAGGMYTINLTSGAGNVNALATNSGLTQIRVRFKLDDNNNNIANYLSLFSGNSGSASSPKLVIQYYVP